MDTVELDALIARASQQRRQLQPEIPREAPKHAHGEFDPAWQTFLDGENTILQFRHSGFGWLSFVIPPHERAHLLSLLVHHALVKQPQPPEREQPSHVPPSGEV